MGLALARWRVVRSFLVFVALATAGAWVTIRHLPTGDAQAARVAPPVGPQTVQSISIEGRYLPLHDLRALLSTKHGDVLVGATLEADRVAIQADLVRRGHLGARVEPAVVTYGAAGGAYVTFQVAQGPLYKLRQVTLSGATARDAVVTLSAGEDADAQRIERAREVVAEQLARRGRPGTVTATVRPDHEAGVVDVDLLFVR